MSKDSFVNYQKCITYISDNCSAALSVNIYGTKIFSAQNSAPLI